MVLQSYVEIKPGVPARMHFVDHWVETITATDPVAGRPLPKRRLRFAVDELNGQATTTYWSTMSQKLAAVFEPFLVDKKYRDYDFIVTLQGSGWQTEYQVQPVPRPVK
jgi:hypothetical protein